MIRWVQKFSISVDSYVLHHVILVSPPIIFDIMIANNPIVKISKSIPMNCESHPKELIYLIFSDVTAWGRH